MATESRHVSIGIDRPAGEVYAYAADPAHLPEWAAGLAETTVQRVDDQWVADSPMGRVGIAFVPANDYGVLDHNVTLPSGEVVYNPLRVVPDGESSCEVIFTVRRRGMTDQEFDADVAAVAKDLATLQRRLERA